MASCVAPWTRAMWIAGVGAASLTQMNTSRTSVMTMFGIRYAKAPTTVYFARALMLREYTMWMLAPTSAASRSASETAIQIQRARWGC
ncbi:hypothetical protein C7974DRAFT_398510 [Boeremia exigua]|uniref:uncharacterized protein n=1 Tax=Boeremia exigua TaxID=749465 RepID=UPI001E8DBA22|nr:uncharacterized protein C7974DRAFT_398510 [Boeremia exigua]KAH6619941.1 hypothetical protein C7974DRAFT_398510 [Boeremia exigua]